MIHSIIKNKLPVIYWKEVISALKQDAAVWGMLQTPKLIGSLRASDLSDLEDWLPVNLGLLYLDLPMRAKDFLNSESSLLNGDLFNKAMNLLEEAKDGYEIQDFGDAVLIALALREKHCLGDSWQSLRINLQKYHPPSFRSTMVSLFGLVNDPIDLLGNYILGKNQLEHYLLILHTLLSNPIGIDFQTDILMGIISNQWNLFSPQPLDHLRAIQYLSLLNPELALEYSKKLLNNGYLWESYGSTGNSFIKNKFHEIEVQLLISELIKLAEIQNDPNLKDLLNRGKFLDLIVELIFSYSTISSQLEGIRGKENDGIQFFDKLIRSELIINQPVYLKKTLLDLLKKEEYDQALNFMNVHRNQIHSDFLTNSAYAICSFQTGNIQEATDFARASLADIKTDENGLQESLYRHGDIICDFIELLSKIDLYIEAQDLSSRALSYCPQDVNLHLIKGKISLCEDSPEKAVTCFYDASMLEPDNLEIRRQLASGLEKTGKWSDAYKERKYIREKIEKNDLHTDINDLHALAECAIKIGNLDEAYDLCELALNINSENGYSHSLIGKIFIERGEYDSALEHFERGIELSPDLIKAWLALVDAQNQVNDHTGAIETLLAASHAIPSSVDIYLSLGESQLTQKAFTEALATFKRGAEIEPHNTKIALNLGTTLHLLGHLHEAINILEEAHKRKPNNVEVAYEYAKVIIESGDKKSSIPLLETVIQSSPKYPEPYLEYAEAVLSIPGLIEDTHHSDQIIDALQQVIQIDANNPIAYALLGEVYAAKEENTEAKQAYQFALESDLVEQEEWFARLSLGMGRVALALGQEDVALASLQEAVQADPNNPTIYRSLSEVYQSVNLLENALQAARAALNLAIDDIDTLTWYADQMLLISEKGSEESSDLSSNELLKQVQIEALNALQQAIQTAPERADIIIKLGKLQSIIGENARAVNTLNSLIENENASVMDLLSAGKMLSELGDRCGAIALLEHASNLDSSHQDPMILVDLANLYQYEGDYESAINTLDRAQKQYPTFAPIYHTKAKVLLELKNVDEALACLMTGLEITPEDENQISLHLLTGNIYRIKGNLKEAINHGHQGLSICAFDAQASDQVISAVKDMIIFNSELYRAILKPHRGRLLIKGLERKLKIDLTKEIDHCCTYLELFLDRTKDNELTSIISRMVEQNPNHPRVLALQSRIFKRRRDYQTSIQILHSALDTANQQTWNLRANYLSPHTPSLSVWYSLCDAAIELEQWETALYITRQILECVPEEPRALINLTKTIVNRAEYQRLCELTEVTTHAPGPSVLSSEARREFEVAISTATKNIPSLNIPSSDEKDGSETNKINPIINRWNARGLAIFGDNEEITQAVGDLVMNSDHNDENKPQLNADDISALIAAETRLGNINDSTNIATLTQTTREYPLDPKLHLQAAIALSRSQPLEAIIHLDQLRNQPRSNENPYTIIASAFSANLANHLDQIDNAKSSIDTAIGTWPNEPRWQILAAEIYQKLGNFSEAIHHIDEAIQIEPNNLENHLMLGKLLIDSSDIDLNYPKRAVQVLERACRLKPEESDPWFYLARAYLILMEIEQAVSCADMAINLAPNSIAPIVLRSEIALYQQDPISAIDFANQALEINKNDLQTILIKSQALRDLGRASDALKILEAAMENMDDPLTLHIEYAILLKDVRGPQASIEALQTLVENYPEDPNVLSLLAKNMADTGQIDAAIQIAQRALQISNGNLMIKEKAELHYLLGKLLIQVRQLDQAIHHLSESISLIPNYVEPYLELGNVHQERRQYLQALEAYQKATKIAPNDPRPHYRTGIALKEGKDYQASESMLRRAAELAPDDVNIRRQLAAVVALNLVHNPRPQRIVEE